MIHSKITSKGQTTVPKEVRDALGLKPGDGFIWEVRDGRVSVRKPKDIMDFAGILYDPTRRAISIEEMNEGIAEAAAESYRRSLE